MSYNPTTWANGDIITVNKLNKIEQGIANVVDAVDDIASNNSNNNAAIVIINQNSSAQTLTSALTAEELFELCCTNLVIAQIKEQGNLYGTSLILSCYNYGDYYTFNLINLYSNELVALTALTPESYPTYNGTQD